MLLPQDSVSFHVLVADGDPSIRKACCSIAAREGIVAHEIEHPASARSFLLAKGADAVLIDEAIATGDGFALMEELRELRPEIAVVWMTSASTVQLAVDAMRYGASDYLIKPFSAEELAAALRRLASRRRLDAASRELRERLRSGYGLGGMLGQSPEMEKLFRIVSRVARSAHPVLIEGELGTGKEMIARAIHANGPAAGQPFIVVDCASVARDRIEGELFGYSKGAIPGALRADDGVLASAGNGTVLLDEVGELPPDVQAKLLRALQDKEVCPVGADDAVSIDARVLAASHHELQPMVEQGKFRRDLYQRLGVVKLTLPPLRERGEDIPLLAAHFLERNSREMRRAFRLSAETLAYLTEYPWPENVRELSNAIDRACSLSSGEVIEMGEMTTAIKDSWMHANIVRRHPAEPAEAPVVETLAEMEKRAILTTLDQVKGDKMLAARLLDIGKTTLYRKLKEYGVQL
ncbi:MAG TPA: sigma-54 dependent transcriptional regulator [Acidobacteriaceae bacterium]|nr:sigma-54 dependent transcriptional regulator [Acidobacteriaceae bacterium]